jgi:hypothetical protein
MPTHMLFMLLVILLYCPPCMHYVIISMTNRIMAVKMMQASMRDWVEVSVEMEQYNEISYT